MRCHFAKHAAVVEALASYAYQDETGVSLSRVELDRVVRRVWTHAAGKKGAYTSFLFWFFFFLTPQKNDFDLKIVNAQHHERLHGLQVYNEKYSEARTTLRRFSGASSRQKVLPVS